MLQTKVSFEAKSEIALLLGEKGLALLQKEIDLIQDAALQNGLPLEKITVGVARDSEIKTWKYILAKLVFNSTFDEADAFFKLIFSLIDTFESTMDTESKAVLLDKLYYVFETV